MTNECYEVLFLKSNYEEFRCSSDLCVYVCVCACACIAVNNNIVTRHRLRGMNSKKGPGFNVATYLSGTVCVHFLSVCLSDSRSLLFVSEGNPKYFFVAVFSTCYFFCFCIYVYENIFISDLRSMISAVKINKHFFQFCCLSLSHLMSNLFVEIMGFFILVNINSSYLISGTDAFCPWTANLHGRI